MDELAANYRHQVEELEANLSAHQQASEQRRREVDQAQAQIDQLHGRIAELQTELQHAEANAKRAATLEQRAGANSALEQALRSEIDRLIGEAQERNQILQDRNEELVRVKTDLDGLTERFTQLESQAVQAEKNADGETESMQTEYQAQLALLQAELSQKEWALEERQAIIAGLEQEHRHELEALRQQLAAKEVALTPAPGAFVLGDPNLTDEQRDKLKKLDDIESELRNGDALGTSLLNRRRWPGGFGSKRRWRS